MALTKVSGWFLLKATLILLFTVSGICIAEIYPLLKSFLYTSKVSTTQETTSQTRPILPASLLPSAGQFAPPITRPKELHPNTGDTTQTILPPQTLANKTKLSYATSNLSKSILIVENRPLNLEIVKNFLAHSGNDWSFEFYVPNNESIKRPVMKVLEAAQRRYSFEHRFDNLLKDIQRNRDLNGLFQACRFWKSVKADVVLVAQMDSVMCPSNYTLEDFLQFPYVGAPWVKPGMSLRLTAKMYGGNGGFSLRHRGMMLECCDKSVKLHSLSASLRQRNEDIYFSKCLRRKRVSVPLGVASSFAVESIITANSTFPIGFHKPRLNVIATGLDTASIMAARKLVCQNCPSLHLILTCDEKELDKPCSYLSYGTVSNKPSRMLKCEALDGVSCRLHANQYKVI